jgi:hypothetical protein
MGNVCVDGLYDGRPADTPEDKHVCVENGGHIQPGSSSGSSVHLAMMGLASGKTMSSLVPELILLPLRLVRKTLPHSGVLAALETLNDNIVEDLERILSIRPELVDELFCMLLDASYFAGAMLQSDTADGEKSRVTFVPQFYERIAKASDSLELLFTSPLHQQALKVVVSQLHKLVGKSASEVYAVLREPEAGVDLSSAIQSR